jgi:phosphoserine phosphatase
VKARKARFDAVCFDFDSTLTRLEGIDELARRVGVETTIAPLTALAMDGAVALDEVYSRRLEIIRPDRAAVSWLSVRYLEEMVPGADTTVDALHRAGVAVYIVSGGLREAILPLAAKLGILPERVYAVGIEFGADGLFEDFDRTSPLVKSDGKAVICHALFQDHGAIAVVGDGSSDIAAKTSGAYVIGFGGVAAREIVRREADIFISGPSLTGILDVLFED